MGSHINGLSLYTACGGGGGGGREADETLLRLRGKSCVGQVLASSSLCACPESFFFSFSNSNGFPCRTGFDCFLLEWRQKNEFELRSLKYSQIWRPDAESDNKNWKSWQSFCLTGNRNKTITGRRAHSKRPSRTVKRTIKKYYARNFKRTKLFQFSDQLFSFSFFLLISTRRVGGPGGHILARSERHTRSHTMIDTHPSRLEKIYFFFLFWLVLSFPLFYFPFRRRKE